MKRIVILAATSLLFMANKAPAPLYGGFEDLDKLIGRAEFIVVAQITKRPPLEEMDMGAGGTFEIEVIKVIKGDMKPKKSATAYLRDLPFNIGPPRGMAAVTQGFVPGQWYLLFLNKPGTHIRDEKDKPLPVDFENENCEGDAVWISSSDVSPTAHFDLESLNGKSVRESVVALLNHAATEQQKFATAVKAMIESRASNALTQKLTQVVWLDSDPEEAARFYLSIFKHSSKDPNLDHYTEIGRDPKATAKGVRLWIDGQDLVLLKAESKSRSESAELTLNCDLQEEIDYYWEKLSAGGQKSKAGWVKDKFGVWWHIIPADLPRLLGGKYGDSAHVKNVLLEMDKIDSAALWCAAH